MKKEQREQARARSAYVPPRTEVYGEETNELMVASGQHNPGGNDGEVTGTKEMNFNISFSNVWDE